MSCLVNSPWRFLYRTLVLPCLTLPVFLWMYLWHNGFFLCVFVCVCLTPLSIKGYYSKSPYDDGYVSFHVCIPPTFQSFPRLACYPDVYPSSSPCLLPPSLPLQHLYTVPFVFALYFCVFHDSPSLMGCMSLFVVRMGPSLSGEDATYLSVP